VLLQASARAYSALASALQQAQQQTQQLAATQQALQPGQQGVPLLDARRQGSSSQVRRKCSDAWLQRTANQQQQQHLAWCIDIVDPTSPAAWQWLPTNVTVRPAAADTA
jgi:hypothetical protein